MGEEQMAKKFLLGIESTTTDASNGIYTPTDFAARMVLTGKEMDYGIHVKSDGTFTGYTGSTATPDTANDSFIFTDGVFTKIAVNNVEVDAANITDQDGKRIEIFSKIGDGADTAKSYKGNVALTITINAYIPRLRMVLALHTSSTNTDLVMESALIKKQIPAIGSILNNLVVNLQGVYKQEDFVGKHKVEILGRSL